MSIVEEYQSFRKILCVCPCCNQLVRVSDLRLKLKGPAEKTWLDEYETQDNALSETEQAFEAEKEKLLEAAREKGRKEAEKAFKAAICPSLIKLNLNPFDIKAIFHPIDFIVFNGMTSQDSISDIMLLTREHNCTSINPLRKQIQTAVTKKNYDWQVARIDDKGNIILE